MHSAFLVFDLIGSNATLKCERNARGFIHPEFDDREGSGRAYRPESELTTDAAGRTSNEAMPNE
jgi:hypothetical protein